MKIKLPSRAKPSKVVSRDESRPQLTRAFVRVAEGGQGQLLATDSYRCVFLPVEVTGDDPADVQVPRRALKAAEKTGHLAVKANHVMPVYGDGRSQGVAYERPNDCRTDTGDSTPGWVAAVDAADAKLSELATQDRFCVGVNADLLAEVAQALGSSNGMVILTFDLSQRTERGTYERAVLVTADEVAQGARALLMPVKITGERDGAE